MAHTNFVSSIRWRPSQPLICTKNKQKQILWNFKKIDVSFKYWLYSWIFIYILFLCLYILYNLSIFHILYILYVLLYFETCSCYGNMFGNSLGLLIPETRSQSSPPLLRRSTAASSLRVKMIPDYEHASGLRAYLWSTNTFPECSTY